MDGTRHGWGIVTLEQMIAALTVAVQIHRAEYVWYLYTTSGRRASETRATQGIGDGDS